MTKREPYHEVAARAKEAKKNGQYVDATVLYMTELMMRLEKAAKVVKGKVMNKKTGKRSKHDLGHEVALHTARAHAQECDRLARGGY